MAFRDFAFPQVQQLLGVRVEGVDLFSGTPPSAVRPEFAAFLRDGTFAAVSDAVNGVLPWIMDRW